MRTLLRTTVAALLAASLSACVDETDPLSPEITGARQSDYRGDGGEFLTAVTSPDIALLGFLVSGPDLESPLLYQIPLTSGNSSMPLSLPAGKGYELAVQGYDRYGEQTFEGRVALDYVEVGANKALAVDLNPTGEGKRAGATIGLVGVEPAPKGLQIVIEADRKEIGEGQSVRLHVFGIDLNGNRIDIDPSEIRWAIADPRTGRFLFDDLAKRDDVVGFYAHDSRYQNRLDFIADYHGLQGFEKLALLENRFADVSAGKEVTCAVRQLGELSCWGSNETGMLGQGSVRPADRCLGPTNVTVDCSIRQVAVGGSRLFSSVSVGNGHVCALESGTGNAFCWGRNGQGQLGVPGTATVFAPVAVSPTAGSSTPLSFRSISAGNGITCGVTAANAEFCWGAFNGTSTATPTLRANNVAASTAAHLFSCRMDGIGVWCDGTPNVGSQALGWSFLGQATTARHVCAIAGSGVTWCWGDNTNGQLGDGSSVNNRTSVSVTLNSVATGFSNSCGLAGAIAFCWGDNLNGQLGEGSLKSQSKVPLRVARSYATTPGWVKITTGDKHACAIDDVFGDIWCWGANYHGQLGNATRFDFDPNSPRQGTFEPVRIVGI